MLRATVELWPGGRESRRRVIATAKIGRVKNGALADYEIALKEDPLDTVGDIAVVRFSRVLTRTEKAATHLAPYVLYFLRKVQYCETPVQ
ncbi:hypothetical protein BN2475_630052 [Paraburkholderia ribeironis]|uniref:Uncharacterized protein n=1 Tax=Paraburkholderia ribeironis TaxID=1247936 RepID=A0A1N7SGV0_9BURK|nr:hypothetical protein BN2475_630052 [Paraburkholderia ribeironis]